MKKFLYLFLFFFFISVGGWAASGSFSPSADVISVKNFQVQRLKLPPGREFLLSALLGPFQKRQINVYIVLQGYDCSFDSCSVPAYKPLSQAMFDYVQSAWLAWRKEANAFLPEECQLPQLSFSLYDSEALKNRQKNSSSTIDFVFDLAVGKFGFKSNSDVARGAGLARFDEKGNGMAVLKFFVEQEWFDWLNMPTSNSANDASEKEEWYQRAAAALLAGDNYEHYGSLEQDAEIFTKGQEEFFYRELEKLPVISWHKKGYWAAYNQRIISHEFGHILGLTHIDNESSSLMKAFLPKGNAPYGPSAMDGLRLAVLACWYQNQMAGKTVCQPVANSSDSKQEKSRAVLAQYLKTMRKK